MNAALFIHSCRSADPTVARHWPFYKKSGWPIFGVSCLDTRCQWPEPVPTKAIGIDVYRHESNLSRRITDTFRWFLEDDLFKGYSHACVIEYDAIFLRPLPTIYEQVDAAATLAGHSMAGYQAEHFFHCPWILSRAGAEAFVKHADTLIKLGHTEHGSPDVFWGLVFQTLPDKMGLTCLTGTYSRNSMDNPSDRIEVNRRIHADECWFVHGIKNEQQLREIVA